MQLLHLDSSMLGDMSVSRQLSAQIVARQRALHPDLDVVYRDLDADPVFHLSGRHLALQQGAAIDDAALNDDLAKGNVYIDDLFAADLIVIGAPMYNFSIPTPLKAWIDRVSVAGKTFHYTEHGPQGLLTGKRAFVASARGGIYSPGSPAAPMEHQESYLLGVLAFLGITDVTVVRAEGMALGPDAKAAAVAHALDEIAALAA